jgi:DNA-binding MarR family transcriptional regulator
METWKPQHTPRRDGLDGPTAAALEGIFRQCLNLIAPPPQSAGDNDLIGFACPPIAELKPAIGSVTTSADHTMLMKNLYGLRRDRYDIFPADIFADPAWDILIDLYRAKLEFRHISVSDACIAACVPPTTALRHIGKLDQMGLLKRVQDQHDGRRVYLELTTGAERMMAGWSTRALSRFLPVTI